MENLQNQICAMIKQIENEAMLTFIREIVSDCHDDYLTQTKNATE